MSGSNTFQSVTKALPCPICGKPDWCSFIAGQAKVVCNRVAEGGTKCRRGQGYLHLLNQATPRRAQLVAYRRIATPLPDFGPFVERCEKSIVPAAASTLARQLSLPWTALRALHVGWSAEHCAWSFPMRDEQGRVVGIRLRSRAGKKFAVKGSRQGLFYPTTTQAGMLWVVTEGPTDCAAAIALGFFSIGLPCAGGAVGTLIQLVSIQKPSAVVLVADNDDVGRRAMRGVADQIRLYVPSVQLLLPSAGVKDLRAWYAGGLCRDEFIFRSNASEPISLVIAGGHCA